MSQLQDSRFTHPYSKDHPADFKPAYADRAAWEKRADFLKHQALVAQGLWPMPEKTPMNPVIHGRIEREHYTVENVFFASLPGHYVTGNLYRPKGMAGRRPAVLSPYGHWPNGRLIYRSDEDVRKDIDAGYERSAQAARSPLQARCAMLARMGCVVFMYDMVGYCDSMQIPHREGFLDAGAVLRAQSFMGLQTWNSVRSFDFVASLPDVDPDRIAVTGASSGGSQTIALEAVDDRPCCTFPVVMISMNMQGGCVCENAPLYRVETNNVELACLYAPKPQGAAAAKDWTHDFETRGMPEMKSIYGLYGSADNVEGKFLPYPHNFNVHSRELMYDFMNRKLNLGWPTPVTEEPFEPISPEKLKVYTAEHPLPKDATDAAGVRAWMTRAADGQLARLRADDDKYREAMRIALRSIVVDDLPSADDVDLESLSNMPSEVGQEKWAAIFCRKRTAERLGVSAVFPKGWNGVVTVWAHPDGSKAVRDSDSRPAEDIVALLASGSAVIAPDLFMCDHFKPLPVPEPAEPIVPKLNSNPPYIAYSVGYNRSILANRVHDLLTVIAWLKGLEGVKSIRIVGIGEAGPGALLAAALADRSVDRAAFDLNGFDFDQITSDAHPLLLPGALKYGGLLAFAQLRTTGTTHLCHAASADAKRWRLPAGVTLDTAARSDAWLARKVSE